MALSKIILVWFLFILSQVVFSQEDQNKGLSESGSSIFDSKEKTLHLVSEMQKKDNENYSDNLRNNNGVQIQQIGNYNTIDTNLKAKTIDVSISQNGDENQVVLDKEANAIKEKIVQVGQNNSIMDVSLYSNYDTNMDIKQEGDNQNVQSYGTNSLSKNMKVTQSGNGASVIIINN